jgi:hypothetical protein
MLSRREKLMINRKHLVILVIFLLSLGLLCAITACSPVASPSSQPTTKENMPPVIQEFSGPTDWAPLTEGTFQCIAVDPDGDNLTYKWAADNGTIIENGNEATWTSPANMGKYKITVTIVDGKGGEVSGVKDVKVLLNADGSQTLDPPVILNLSFLSENTTMASKRLRAWTAEPVECIVEGVNATGLKFSWKASDGKLQANSKLANDLKEGTASKVIWIAPGTGGDYIVDVVVTDKQGKTAKGTVNFKVFCCGNY